MAAAALRLQLRSLGGERWELDGVGREATVGRLREQAGEAAGIPAHEIRLLVGTRELVDNELVSSFADTAGTELTLVRREPEQARWLQRVQKKWTVLCEAPEAIRDDSEVVLAALKQDPAALWFASPKLSADGGFVAAAAKQAGWPEVAALDVGGRGGQGLEKLLRKCADVNLALLLAASQEAPDLAKAAFGAPVVQRGTEEERIALLGALALVDVKLGPEALPGAVSELLRGLPRHTVQRGMAAAVLPSLRVGIDLLAAGVEAPERSGLSHFFSRLLTSRNMSILGPGFGSQEEFAMALFVEHAAALATPGEVGRENGSFQGLLPHLEGHQPPTPEVCCSLVQACLARNLTQQAQDFFFKGADASEQCAALLADSGLPLSLLQGQEHRAELLSAIIARWGGNDIVPAAVAEDRRGLRGLLRASAGDAEIGRLPELVTGLCAAVAAGEEVAGRALLRAYVSAEPKALPEFCEVPLAWLAELRDIRGCSGLAIDAFLAALAAQAEDSQYQALASRHWADFAWDAASGAQVDAAVEALRRWARAGALEAVGQATSWRDAEVRRLDLAASLCDALRALPLVKMHRSEALLAPELPPQGAAMLASARLGQVERQAAELKEEVARARRESRQRTESLEEDVRTLRRRVDDVARQTRQQ